MSPTTNSQIDSQDASDFEKFYDIKIFTAKEK